MRAQRLAADRLLVPMRAEGPNGEIGDGTVEIGPGHPQFQQWATWLDRQEPVGKAARPRLRARRPRDESAPARGDSDTDDDEK